MDPLGGRARAVFHLSHRYAVLILRTPCRPPAGNRRDRKMSGRGGRIRTGVIPGMVGVYADGAGTAPVHSASKQQTWPSLGATAMKQALFQITLETRGWATTIAAGITPTSLPVAFAALSERA